MTALTKPKLIVYLVGIFVAGAVSGGFLGYNMKEKEARRRPPNRPPSAEQMIGFIREKFAEEIGVTDEQWQSKIGPIVTNTSREISDLDSRNRERVGEIIARSDALVMDALTEEQRPRLQKMIEDRNKHFRERKGERHGRNRDWEKFGNEKSKQAPSTNEPPAAQQP